MKFYICLFSVLCVTNFAFSAKIRSGDYPVGSTILKAEKDTKPFAGELGALPTGYKDFVIDEPSNEKSIIVNAADFGMSEELEDNSAALSAALKHCKEIGASKLVVTKGKYKFFAKSSGVDIIGFKDFVFDANNSLFVYRKERKANFTIENCSRIRIENLRMDWDWKTQPLASIVKVVGVSIEKENPYIDFKFIHYDDYHFYGDNIPITSIISYDIKTRSLGVVGRRPINGNYAGMKNIISTKRISPNVVRCVFVSPDMPKRTQVGYTYRMQHAYYDCNAFNLVSNDNMVFKNIDIYSCKGFGFRVDGSQRNWRVEDVNIAPKGKAKKRCISCTADSLHVARSLGNFQLVNCRFTHGADDCVNIHDSTEYVSRVDDYTIRIPRRKNERYHTIDCLFELRYSDFVPTNFLSKATKIKSTGNTINITFDKKLPDDGGKGFVLFNRKYWSKNFLMKDCVFGYNRARGMILATDNCTIENCKFENIDSGGIKIEAGHCPGWAEGYGVDNIVVKNCEFNFPNRYGCVTNGMPRDIVMYIYLFVDDSTAPKAHPILKNVLFEGNKFINQMGLVAFMACCDNVIFKDNIISNPDKMLREYKVRGGFYAVHSSNIKIVNNTYIASPYLASPTFGYDPKSVENVIFAGNKIVDAEEDASFIDKITGMFKSKK